VTVVVTTGTVLPPPPPPHPATNSAAARIQPIPRIPLPFRYVRGFNLPRRAEVIRGTSRNQDFLTLG